MAQGGTVLCSWRNVSHCVFVWVAVGCQWWHVSHCACVWSLWGVNGGVFLIVRVCGSLGCQWWRVSHRACVWSLVCGSLWGVNGGVFLTVRVCGSLWRVKGGVFLIVRVCGSLGCQWWRVSHCVCVVTGGWLQKPGPGEHPLQYNYSIWFSRRSPKNTTYDQSLKFISSFASVSAQLPFCSSSTVCLYTSGVTLPFF